MTQYLHWCQISKLYSYSSYSCFLSIHPKMNYFEIFAGFLVSIADFHVMSSFHLTSFLCLGRDLMILLKSTLVVTANSFVNLNLMNKIDNLLVIFAIWGLKYWLYHRTRFLHWAKGCNINIDSQKATLHNYVSDNPFYY